MAMNVAVALPVAMASAMTVAVAVAVAMVDQKILTAFGLLGMPNPAMAGHGLPRSAMASHGQPLLSFRQKIVQEPTTCHPKGGRSSPTG